MFTSDNWAGAHPAVSESLSRHASGFAAAYGTSDLDRAVEERIAALFEREVAVMFVATGTAANALAMAAVNRPGGVVFAHREAHVIEDECGAVEHLTGGARLRPVDGALGRLDARELERQIAAFGVHGVHSGQPMAVTVTQGTEVGTHYTVDEVREIAHVAHGHGIPLHMDGARFANALVASGASPADMTWRAGVDVLSFGATKNGCWCAEALVFFDAAMAEHVAYLRKRAAQLLSKTRFVAAQFDAHLHDELWLRCAEHANAAAERLRARLVEGGAELAWETTTNEVFAWLTPAQSAALDAAGLSHGDWGVPHGVDAQDGRSLKRFVTSFATRDEDVDHVGVALSSVAGRQAA